MQLGPAGGTLSVCLCWGAISLCSCLQCICCHTTHTNAFKSPQGTTRIEFKIATRGLLGLKNSLLTATRGMGLLNTIFDEVRFDGTMPQGCQQISRVPVHRKKLCW